MMWKIFKIQRQRFSRNFNGSRKLTKLKALRMSKGCFAKYMRSVFHFLNWNNIWRLSNVDGDSYFLTQIFQVFDIHWVQNSACVEERFSISKFSLKICFLRKFIKIEKRSLKCHEVLAQSIEFYSKTKKKIQ